MATFGVKSVKSAFEKQLDKQKERENIAKDVMKMMKGGSIEPGISHSVSDDRVLQKKWLANWSKFLYVKVYFPFRKFFFDIRNYALRTFGEILGPLQEYVELLVDAVKGIVDIAKNVVRIVWKGISGGLTKLFGGLGITKAMKSTKDAVVNLTSVISRKLDEVKTAFLDGLREGQDKEYKRQLRMGGPKPKRGQLWEDLLLIGLGLLIVLLRNLKIGDLFDRIKNAIIDALKGIGLFQLFKGIKIIGWLSGILKKAFSAIFEGLGIYTLIKKIPGLSKVTEIFESIGKGIGRFFKNIGGLWKDAKELGWAGLAARVPGNLKAFKTLVLFKMIQSFFHWIGEIGKGIGTVLSWIPIIGQFGKVVKFFGKLFKFIPIIGQIVAVISSMFDFFAGFKESEAQKMFGDTGIIAMIMSGFAHVISGLTFGLISPEKIGKALKGIIDVFLWWIDGWVQLIETSWGLIKGGYNLIKDAWDAIVGWWDKNSEWLKNMAIEILKWILIFPKILDVVDSFFPGVKDKVYGVFKDIKDWILEALGDLWEAIKGFARKLNPLNWLKDVDTGGLKLKSGFMQGLVGEKAGQWASVGKGVATAVTQAPGKMMAGLTKAISPGSAYASTGPSISNKIPGGVMADRMNNPGNIKASYGPGQPSAFGQEMIKRGWATEGDPGDGGTFLKFKSKELGMKAAEELLTGKAYSGLSVDAALKKWSNQGYNAQSLGLGNIASRKVGDLSSAERTRMESAMFGREAGRNITPEEIRAGVGTGGGSPEVYEREREAMELEAERQKNERARETGKERPSGMQSASMANATGGQAPGMFRDDIPTMIAGLNVLPIVNGW
jgi:hypothetical protein